MLIAKIQKKVLFDEAARSAIQSSQLLQISQIYSNLLGVTDIGIPRYGNPLTPVYDAQSGQTIQIPRIASYFQGLSRDIFVADLSLTEIENNLITLNLEVWARIQMVKNRANDLAAKASLEQIRSSIGATWSFTDNFNDTSYVDMSNTSAWIDSSEGIAFIPNSGQQHNIVPSDITIISETAPTNGDFLGSSASQAFDGLSTTNWICSFVAADGSTASTIESFVSPKNITAISIDPVGFGINITLWIDNGSGWVQALQAVLYNKTTFPISYDQVTQIKISFTPATAVYPKVVGIREIVLFSTDSVPTAELWTKELVPSQSFTELQVTTTGQVPNSTSIDVYFRATSGDVWTPINNDWISIAPTLNNFFTFTSTQLQPNIGDAIMFRSLYGLAIPPQSSPPLTNQEGVLQLGLNQIEVSSFSKDYASIGSVPHQLSSSDFDVASIIKAWTSVPTIAYNSSSAVVQFSDSPNILNNPRLTTGGDLIAFQRQFVFAASGSIYNQLVIIPAVGDPTKGPMQYGYNYRLRFWVHATQQFNIPDAQYWFYQGYRQTGGTSYDSISKSYGSFTMLINDIVVAGSIQPETVWTTSIQPSNFNSQSTPFTMVFEAGWNKVDVLINSINPSIYGNDVYDLPPGPYLQLSLYPSLFDSNFKQDPTHPIDSIVGSGEFNSVSEFDLIWNLPKDPSFWSWTGDRNYIIMNTNQQKLIDGYFSGQPTNNGLVYRGATDNETSSIFLRFVLDKPVSSNTGPILDSYNLLVK